MNEDPRITAHLFRQRFVNRLAEGDFANRSACYTRLGSSPASPRETGMR